MAIANLLIKIGADISELKTGSDKALATMEKTGAKIDSIGAGIKKTLISAFSIGAVIGFGKELVTMADNIVRTADRTGLLTDEVQKLSFVASQSGNSLEEITGALGQMQNRLASGDKSALSGVKSLGLSFEELRRQNPFEQFTSIAEAIGKIPNPATRAQVAMDLFGRSGIAILPTLTANVAALGNAVPLMSEKTIRALDKAGDQFDQLLLTIKVWAAESYNFAGRAFDSIVAAGMRLIAGFADVTAGMLELAQKIPGSSKVFPDLADKIKKTREEAEWYRDAAKSMTARTNEMAVSVRKAVPPFEAATTAIKRKTAATKAAETAAQTFSMDLTNNMIPVVARLGVEVAIVVPKVEDLGAQLTYVSGIPFGSKIGEQIAIVPPQVMAASNSFDVLMSSLQGVMGLFGSFGYAVNGIIGDLKHAEAANKKWGGSAGIASALFSKQSTSAEKWGAAVESGAAVASGAMNVWAATSGNATKSANTLHGAVAGAKAGAAFGPYGAAVGAAAGALIGFVRALDAGRDKVKDFAKSFGGFDDLHKKLGELGAQGEQFWIKLTQGVGKSNPTQAQKVINEITAALNKQANQTAALSGIMEEYGFTWEDLGEKARGAKLAELFDTLFEKTQILKEAGIDYSEILRRQSTDYSELVQAAIRTGSEIPLAMRPVLEELIAMGTLVDANGVAFSDLGDVTFAKTLTQGFDQVTLAIRELTAALTDGVGGALDALGRKVIKIPIKFDVDEIPGGGGDIPGFAGGTHGRLLNFGPRGTPVMLHNQEGVFTEQDVARGLELGTGVASDSPVVNVYIGNEAIDPRMVKVARKDASRGGLRPRAAHGRSY